MVCWTLLETRLVYGYYVFSGLSFPIVLSLSVANSPPVLSPTSHYRASNQAVLSLVALRRTTGFELDNLGRCVAHRFSAGSRIREAFRCGRSTCVPCRLSCCTSTAFSSWTTMLSSLSLVRFDFVLGAMDSDVTSSEHFSGCSSSGCTTRRFSTWMTVTSPSRCGFVETLWIQRLLPLNISRAVHPQVVHTSRFNMDDCDELIPLWFCRDVEDSEVSSSEHILGFKAACMAL